MLAHGQNQPALKLSDAERQQLEQWVAAHGSRSKWRCAAGLSWPLRPERRTWGSRPQQGRCQDRGAVARAFCRGRPRKACGEIAEGRGRKPTHSPNKIKAIIRATLTSKPRGMTQWSCRQMAQAQGVSKVHGEYDLAQSQLEASPHQELQLSRDTRFLEKLTDVVGCT